MPAKLKISPELVGGDVEEGYGKVADAFRRNLESGREAGAAVAVYHDGRKVVDLWGGVADPGSGTPWERDIKLRRLMLKGPETVPSSV